MDHLENGHPQNGSAEGLVSDAPRAPDPHSPRGRKPKRGRKKGTRQYNYWYRKGSGPYRKGHGWYIKGGSEKLLDPDSGQHIRDGSLKKGCDYLENAFRAWKTAQEHAQHQAEVQPPPAKPTIRELLPEFLADVKRRSEEKDAERGIKRSKYERAHHTWGQYYRSLFNLDYGLPFRARQKAARLDLAQRRKLRDEAGINADFDGFGHLPCDALDKAKVRDWLLANPAWKSQKMACTALQSFYAWLTDIKGLFDENPIPAMRRYLKKCGFRLHSRARITTLTVEQEEAMLRYAPRWYRDILYTLIHTGCRPVEFYRLRKRHVHEDGPGRMRWHYPEGSKPLRSNGDPKPITIYIADPR